MKTVVYQSFRTTDVPPWIRRCMQSVQEWAALNSFAYRFFDDEMFSFAPDWYRRKTNDNICLVSDLARLVIAKKFLEEDFQRTIWIDADVIVFDPKQFVIDVDQDFALCRQFWAVADEHETLKGRHGVNNAVSVFIEGNSFLDFYIHACKSIVRFRNRLKTLDVGTRFLTTLNRIMPFCLINQVGLFSPVLMRLLSDAPQKTLEVHQQAFGFPIYAANLCSSFRNTVHQDILMGDDLYSEVVESLLQL